MRNVNKFMIAVSLLSWAGVAFAHPGHGLDGFLEGFSHPLAGIDHLLSMIAIGLWAGRTGGKTLISLPLTSLIMMIIAGTAAVLGISIPFAEIGIFLSLVVVGLVIALKIKIPLPVIFSVVGIFSICHGYAHGIEMPLNANGLEYGFGLAVGSSVLLGAGILFSQLIRREHIVSSFGAIIAFIGLGLLAG